MLPGESGAAAAVYTAAAEGGSMLGRQSGLRSRQSGNNILAGRTWPRSRRSEFAGHQRRTSRGRPPFLTPLENLQPDAYF
jgi:hypothetical protein